MMRKRKAFDSIEEIKVLFSSLAVRHEMTVGQSFVLKNLVGYSQVDQPPSYRAIVAELEVVHPPGQNYEVAAALLGTLRCRFQIRTEPVVWLFDLFE